MYTAYGAEAHNQPGGMIAVEALPLSDTQASLIRRRVGLNFGSDVLYLNGDFAPSGEALGEDAQFMSQGQKGEGAKPLDIPTLLAGVIFGQTVNLFLDALLKRTA